MNVFRSLLFIAVVAIVLPADSVSVAAPKTRDYKHGTARPVPSKRAKSSHAPYESKACMVCHNKKKGGRGVGRPKKNMTKICFTCHSELKRVLGKYKHMHKPVKAGCISCHNPHNSVCKKLLTAPKPRLCTNCHVSIKTKINLKVKHDAMRQGASCSNCHDPHGSNIEKLLLALPYDQCISCHNTNHLKDEKGRLLMNYKVLLGKSKVKHSPVEGKDCSSCHEVHGSKHFRLLTEPYPEHFYAKYSKEEYALCFKCHDEDLVKIKTSRTATGFRDGARNLHYVHVKEPDRGRTCRACHAVHASEQKALIRASVPYGSSGWKLKLHYIRTKNGGSCERTCHGIKPYSRNKR